MSQVSHMRYVLLFLLSFALPGASPPTWAAPRAWLIDRQGSAAKLDLTRHTVTEQVGLGLLNIHLSDVAADPVRGNLFVPWGRDPYLVEVFDLKTLARKGRLDLQVSRAPTADAEIIRCVFPSTGNVFYVRWWNDAAGGSGAFELATIDAKTFKTTARRQTVPPLERRLLLDETGRQLYSMTTWDRPAHVDVFDLSSFMRTTTIDLEAVLNPSAIWRGIEDFGRGKVLIAETERTQEQDPYRFTFFVFDLATRQIGPKIRTGLESDGMLLSQTNRLLLKEVVRRADPQGPRGGRGRPLSPGRIQVYDALTGNRLVTITVPVKDTGWYLGVNPAEDTLYYLTDRKAGTDSSQFILAIVSLQTFSIVKELAVPIGATRMFFFDE